MFNFSDRYLADEKEVFLYRWSACNSTGY